MLRNTTVKLVLISADCLETDIKANDKETKSSKEQKNFVCLTLIYHSPDMNLSFLLSEY